MPISEVMRSKLKRALTASRVALVGASPQQLSVGMGPLFNLLSASFQGEALPVNPKYTSRGHNLRICEGLETRAEQ
jgi:acyl-CoA synthetase (NDP forming)